MFFKRTYTTLNTIFKLGFKVDITEIPVKPRKIFILCITYNDYEIVRISKTDEMNFIEQINRKKLIQPDIGLNNFQQ